MNHKQIAYLLLRLSLGLSMLIHGAGRIFQNYEKFVSETTAMFALSPLPAGLTELFVRVLPGLETLIGTLLILGLGTRYVAILGGLLMMNLLFGMGVLQRWDIVGLQMNYVLFYVLVLYFVELDRYSLDEVLFRKSTAVR